MDDYVREQLTKHRDYLQDGLTRTQEMRGAQIRSLRSTDIEIDELTKKINSLNAALAEV